MIDLGIVIPGSTLRIPFNSFDKDDGSAITMTNYAAADILIYKDGSTTERASTSGFTATTDFDGKTGKHLAIIDLSDDTTADFFKSGSEYLVGIDVVTIDAITTGAWIARFRIGYPNAIIDTSVATLASQTSFTLTTGPAENSALIGCCAIVHSKASAVQKSWVAITGYTGATKTVTLAAGATFTLAAGDNISIMEPEAYTRLGAPAGASVSADVAAVKVDTAAVKVQTDKLAFTVTNQVDANVLDWKSATAPAMTGDAFARLGVPAGASVSVDIAAAKVDTAAIKVQTDKFVFTIANQVNSTVVTANANTIDATALKADAATEIAVAVFAQVFDTLAYSDIIKVMIAVLAGKSNGMDTGTAHFRDVGDTKNVVTVTKDVTGRLTITLNP